MAGVELSVPDSLIENCVRGEIVKALSEHPGLTEKVIQAVLFAPGKDRYGNVDRDSTALRQVFEKMVTTTATEIFGEWVEENRGAIREALLTHLGKNKQRALKEVAAGIVEGMSHYSVRVNFTLGDD